MYPFCQWATAPDLIAWLGALTLRGSAGEWLPVSRRCGGRDGFQDPSGQLAPLAFSLLTAVFGPFLLVIVTTSSAQTLMTGT